MEKATYKTGVIILLLLMTVRHAVFYFDLGFMDNEMGYGQTVLGVFLIPVTSAFGCLYFWERKNLALTKYDTVKFIAIGLLPVLFSELLSHIIPILEYDVFRSGRRPPLLILLPIVTSILIFVHLRRAAKVALGVIFLFYIFSWLFILHYILIFLCFGLLQQSPHFVKFQRSLWPILFYFLSVLLIFVLKVERVSFPMEFLMSISFLSLIFFVAERLSNLNLPVLKSRALLENSILYFYLFQAVFFTLVVKYVSVGEVTKLALIIPIFIASLFLSGLTKKAEKLLRQRIWKSF